MDTGFQGRRQPNIAGDDQQQPPLPANPRQRPPESRSVRIMVVAQNDSGPAARQPAGRGAWIGQTGVVGEQPQTRNATGFPAKAPGKEFHVHAGDGPLMMDNSVHRLPLQDIIPTCGNIDSPASPPAVLILMLAAAIMFLVMVREGAR